MNSKKRRREAISQARARVVVTVYDMELRNGKEQCDLCNGLRGHRCIKDAMCREFKREYDNAWNIMNDAWHNGH